MSAAPVLAAMAAPRRCEQTGLSIPECCCRRCCEAQMHRYAPDLLRIARELPIGVAGDGKHDVSADFDALVLTERHNARVDSRTEEIAKEAWVT